MTAKVRIHLKQAILVGYGHEAKYAKVLVGERELRPITPHHGTVYQSFVIRSFVQNYRESRLIQHPRILLANSNILAIEDMEIENEPWQARRCQTKTCAKPYAHAAHTFRNAGPVIQCPGSPGRY